MDKCAYCKCPLKSDLNWGWVFQDQGKVKVCTGCLDSIAQFWVKRTETGEGDLEELFRITQGNS